MELVHNGKLDQLLENLFGAVSADRAAIAGNLAVTVLGILTLVQVVHALLLGELNAELRSMCGRTVTYIRQLYDYMSWQSDEPVFPFAPFPERDETR